ncbi:POTRA domain-containing protein [Pseudobacteriovorax antillogorgiicola]|uniref:Surface antigen variable number repeat-containing protein n=1 Tax=Pseudobacteriovorax antillogorgiicola TaxID=1513793 RepID=A0A1Y6CKI8_9BACT|nr:POTRA domain-containing protein [Pseudobacteriovorax antillogorgiicola]TCS45885.1 surface antigen-like variable number repeat protein [Pseudobacteriovorax antillogorgiicola]SMF71195.1 Surface antigen variable number repeat-containing protein [Pseudobacteriovorax antillogorgiicola]
MFCLALKKNKFLAVLIILAGVLGSPSLATAQNPREFVLASVQVTGSSRLPEHYLAEELKLLPGSKLNPQQLKDAQFKLYGLGLFKSVFLRLEKANAPKTAILHIELVDDPSVIGPWAIGSTFSLTQGEADSKALGQDSSPMGIRTELISRNLFGALHRGRFEIDMDGEGVYRNIAASYGFPRFSREGVQFDAHVQVTDISQRYMDAMGFGGVGSALWSYDIGIGTFQYGLMLLTNRPPRFEFPGFPKSITAPKVSFERETRLLTFFGSPGYRLKLSLLPSGSWEKTVLQGELGLTQNLGGWADFTIEGSIQGVGDRGLSQRYSSTLDIPLGSSDEQGSFFIKYQYGLDRYDDYELWGRSTTFGLRYHSFGLIAELAFKITRDPSLEGAIEGDPLYD